MIRFASFALAAMALVAAAPAGTDRDPSSYALRLAIPTRDGTVQRVTLPGSVLVASRTPDLADIRVFDARGRSMPVARDIAPAAPLHEDRAKPLPILGAADALTVTNMSLRLDDQGRARVAQVDGTVAPLSGSAVLLGVLFDTRAVTGTVQALTLDADVPVAQPVTFSVAASRDLADWRPIAQRVVYRTPDTAAAPVRLALDAAAVRDDYLRVTWRAASRLLSPVAVRDALLTSRADGDAAPVWVDAVLPPLTDAHAVTVTMPFATPLRAIRVVPQGDDLLMPVRVLGRDDREQPWTLLGTGTAGRDTAIAIDGPRFATLRIEADERTLGFTTPPALHLAFDPRAIVFAAAGTPPFTLAAGRADTPDAYLPRATILAQSDRPPATATVVAKPTIVRLALADVGGTPRRTIVLWAVLLAAVTLLAAMAWLLWRRPMPADPAPPGSAPPQ